MTSKRAKGLLEGAVDLHVHVKPSVRPRVGDSRELAEEADRFGMRALLFKDHDRSTVADAWHANTAGRRVEGAGAVCLNAPSGGLNPAAAEAAVATGARAVFLPTDSARNDGDFWARHLEDPGERSAVLGEARRRFPDRIGVLGPDGALVRPVADVIDICATAGALVCTGHLGADEVTAVVDECARRGARVSVTHAPVFTGAGPDRLAAWARAGALLELVAVFCCGWERLPASVRRSYALDASLIDAVGASAFTLGSDLGQVGNPSPAEGLAAFVEGLLGEGVSEDDVEVMTRKNPARALGLDDAPKEAR